MRSRVSSRCRPCKIFSHLCILWGTLGPLPLWTAKWLTPYRNTLLCHLCYHRAYTEFDRFRSKPLSVGRGPKNGDAMAPFPIGIGTWLLANP